MYRQGQIACKEKYWKGRRETKGLKLGRSKDGKGLPSSSLLDDWLCLPPFTLTLLYFTISLCHFIGKACFSPSWQLIIFLASCFETWREMRNSPSKMAFWCWTLTFKGMKYKKLSCGHFHPYQGPPSVILLWVKVSLSSSRYIPHSAFGLFLCLLKGRSRSGRVIPPPPTCLATPVPSNPHLPTFPTCKCQ